MSYTADSELRLAANEEYFKPDLPHLDEVVMRIIPEKGNQAVALEAGEVHWLFQTAGPDLPRLRESGDYDFHTTSVTPVAPTAP